MSSRSDSLVSKLGHFGLDNDEASIYLYLLRSNYKSALEISREVKVGRTKVYRILRKLIKLGIVNQKLDTHGKKFKAESYEKLELLLRSKESEIESLKGIRDDLFQDLKYFQSKYHKKSRVLYYSGKEGLKQITWNSTKAKDELLIFEIKDMSAFLDYGFCEKVRMEFVRNKVKVKEITNHKSLPAWTDIHEFVRKFWSCRYISPVKLKMKFEILVYNNVLAMYNFKDSDVFCVEIYNESLAEMQKQLFEFLWDSAQEMKIGKGGKASLIK